MQVFQAAVYPHCVTTLGFLKHFYNTNDMSIVGPSIYQFGEVQIDWVRADFTGEKYLDLCVCRIVWNLMHYLEEFSF